MKLETGGAPVAATLSYNAATRTATLDPSADLQAGAIYAATVVGGPGGVKDTQGAALSSSRTWTFTVAADQHGVPLRHQLDERHERLGAGGAQHVERRERSRRRPADHGSTP